MDCLETRQVMTSLTVTTYDFQGSGTIEANLMTGTIDADVDVGAGIHLSTSNLNNFAAPDIDFGEALAAAVGLTPSVTSDYDSLRDQTLKHHPAAYFSSERSTDYASPINMANKVIEGVASAGATVAGSVAELKDILLPEVDDILTWAQTTGQTQALTPEFFEDFVASAATGQSFTVPGFRFEAESVDYTITLAGGPLGGITSQVPLKLPHLGFAIIPTGAGTATDPATLLASFDADKLKGFGSAFQTLLSLSPITAAVAGTTSLFTSLVGQFSL